MITVIKAAVTTKILTDIYNNCSTMYKQAMALKNKPKWLVAI